MNDITQSSTTCTLIIKTSSTEIQWFIYVTIATETHHNTQNDISQEQVFIVWATRFHILQGGLHWKLCSVFFIRWRIEIEWLWFFCNFFCGVISCLWFINTVPFHVQSWNKWMELFSSQRWMKKRLVLIISGSTLQKLSITLKNATIKNYSELHFLQKTQWAHVTISLLSEAKDDPFSNLWSGEKLINLMYGNFFHVFFCNVLMF